MTYRPLPKETSIRPSLIEGLGLFAIISLDEGHEFGITHIKDIEFDDGYIRTPLGGFFNHSENPNCECYVDGRYLKLRSLKPIKANEEITVRYWLYKIK
jgi:hypothetical protein